MSGCIRYYGGQPLRNMAETILGYKQRGQCFKCGLQYKRKHNLRCPAKDTECRKCLKFGHFAQVCWNKRSRGFNKKTEDSKPTTKCYNVCNFGTECRREDEFLKKSTQKVQKMGACSNSVSSGTQTENKNLLLEKATAEAETQPNEANKVSYGISTVSCKSEVACQTNLPDETLRKFRELEFL